MLDRLDAKFDAWATAIGGRGCATRGHLYGGPGGWRACACERTIPAHTATEPDPAGGPGCGMVWRVCARCPHIDEHHLTDHDHDGAGPVAVEPAPVEPDEGLDLLADVADVLAGAEVERMRPRDVLAALVARDRAVYGRWTVADLRAALPVCAQPYKSGGTQQIALSRVREALDETVARSA